MPSLKYHTLPCSPCSERCQGSEANEVFLPEAFLGNNHGAVARAAFQVGSACRNLQSCRALVGAACTPQGFPTCRKPTAPHRAIERSPGS